MQNIGDVQDTALRSSLWPTFGEGDNVQALPLERRIRDLSLAPTENPPADMQKVAVGHATSLR
jgi:hypothetical protein